jgi:hypothetical protein
MTIQTLTINSIAQHDSAGMQPSVEHASGKPYAWILHPAIDLFFVCGGIAWLLFALHYFVLGPNSGSSTVQTFVVIAALGTLLFSETHTVATLVRAYDKDSIREKFSLYTHWAAIICASLTLAGLFCKPLLPIFAKIYLLIVSQHFTAQTYGLVLLYCYKRQYPLSIWEKRLMSLLMQATMWFAVLRQCTYREWSGDIFLGQTLPFWGPLPEWIFLLAQAVLVAAGVAVAFMVLVKAIAEKQYLPLPSAMLLLSGVLIFVFGKQATGILWLYVPAFFHGSQYIVVSTSYYLKEQGLPENVPTSKIASLLGQKRALRYLGFLILAGTFVYIGLPRILEQFGFNYQVAFAAIFTTVNFHHVLIDRVIWKMRDADVRRLLNG